MCSISQCCKAVSVRLAWYLGYESNQIHEMGNEPYRFHAVQHCYTASHFLLKAITALL